MSSSRSSSRQFFTNSSSKRRHDDNLADAIGKSGGSAFLLKTLQAKEADRDTIVESLARFSPRAPDSVDPE